MRSLRWWFGRVAAAIGLGCVALPLCSGASAQVNVTQSTDTGNTATVGSLSWGINQANLNPGSTIDLIAPTIDATGTLPALTTNTTVIGTTALTGSVSTTGLQITTGTLQFGNGTNTGSFIGTSSAATAGTGVSAGGGTTFNLDAGSAVTGGSTTADSTTGGNGVQAGGSASLMNLNNAGTITGGAGSQTSGAYGFGGNGVSATGSVSIVNSGLITGGQGGGVAGGGGQGGYGISAISGTGQITILNQTGGTIRGGPGGVIGSGDINGQGIYAAGNVTITNQSGASILGDQTGLSGVNFSGGAGISANSGATVVNSGVIAGSGGSTGGGSGIIANQATITNTSSGSITGGNGTEGGPGAPAITGNNTTVTNAGSIVGGSANSGTGTQADAIVFTGGTNTLTLQTGSSISGNVVGTGVDSLQLSGTGTGGFNLSLIGTQFTGFSNFNLVSGDWNLSGGAAAFAGTTTVEAGTLALGAGGAPGVVLGGKATISAGATLSGPGTIGGNVTNAGTIAPTVSGTGTLTIGGTYTQASTGKLSIEVTPSSASNLAVGGAANLGGTLALIFAPGTYTLGTSYTLLTASSISGTFSSVTGTNPSGLSQSIVYNTDPSVVLQLNSAVVAPTNDTIFRAADSIAIITAQQVNGIILDRVGARAAGVADGEVAAAPGLLQFAQAGAGNAGVASDIAAALPGALSSQGGWFRGVGGFASVNGNSAAPGFTGSTGGFLGGYDRAVAPNLYLGVAGGYLHSSIGEHSTSNGSEDSARFAVYGGMLVGGDILSGTVGYAHDWFDTQRGFAGIGTAAESHGGDEATAAAQWSRPLSVVGIGGGIATLTPKAGLQYLHLSEAAFGELGAGAFDLGNSGHATDSLQPYVEAALSQKFTTESGTVVTPELRLGYAYEVYDSRLLTVTTAGGTVFPVTGVAPSRNQLSAGLGLVVQSGPALSLYADYDTILHTGNTTEQTVQAGLRVRF